jgi:hypothetical protein
VVYSGLYLCKKFQLHLLTPLLHRIYVQVMSSTFLPARMHFAPVNAGVMPSSVGIAPTGISSSTITITTTTGTGTGWESVRE